MLVTHIIKISVHNVTMGKSKMTGWYKERIEVHAAEINFQKRERSCQKGKDTFKIITII